MRLRASSAGPLLALVPLLLAPATARAAEGERNLALGIDYGTFLVGQEQPGDAPDEVTAQGGMLSLDYRLGHSDVLWWRVSASGGPYAGPDGLTWGGGGTVGVSYNLDVLRYVPFAEFGVGVLVVGGGGVDTAVKPVVELGLGLEVLESRTFSWGVVFRFDSFASQAVFFTAGARIAWRWGFW